MGDAGKAGVVAEDGPGACAPDIGADELDKPAARHRWENDFLHRLYAARRAGALRRAEKDVSNT